MKFINEKLMKFTSFKKYFYIILLTIKWNNVFNNMDAIKLQIK